jgi:hypothetical protein
MRGLCAAGGDEGFGGDAADAAEDGLDGPYAFGVREEDFPGAADFWAVIPSIEKGQMALSDNCIERSL